MSILKNNLKRVMRDKFNLIVMIIMPVIFIALSIFSSSGSVRVRIGVIDDDDTFLTQYLIQGLEKNCTVTKLEEDEIKENMINNKIEYAIKIYKGFTNDILLEKDAVIKSYGIKDYNGFIPVKLNINSFMNSVKTIAKASKGDLESFKKGISCYLGGYVSATYRNVSGCIPKISNINSTLRSLSYLVMFMMYLSINAASLITEDKKLKTYERILMSRISIKRYAFENVLSFFAVIWIQILMLFAIMKFIFRLDFGSSIINLIIFTFIYSSVSVSLGMAIVNLSRTFKQLSSATPLIVVPMAMLGGGFWPIWLMPDILQKVSSFIPITWALQGMEKILQRGNLMCAGKEIIILILFSLVFFLIGSERKSSFV